MDKEITPQTVELVFVESCGIQAKRQKYISGGSGRSRGRGGDSFLSFQTSQVVDRRRLRPAAFPRALDKKATELSELGHDRLKTRGWSACFGARSAGHGVIHLPACWSFIACACPWPSNRCAACLVAVARTTASTPTGHHDAIIIS